MRQKSWQQDLKLEEYGEDSFSKHTESKALQIVGQDKDGRCLVYINGGNIHPDLMEPYDFIRYFYYTFYHASRDCSPYVDQYTIITDCDSAGLSNISISTLSQLFPAINVTLSFYF